MELQELLTQLEGGEAAAQSASLKRSGNLQERGAGRAVR
jgi:hypothetical protein